MSPVNLFRLIVLLLIAGNFSFMTEINLAQTQSSHFVLKRDNTGTLTLYSVSVEGDLQKLFQFPANISLNTDQANAEWNVLSIESFVPSPNGQHIAFVAYHDETTLALFVYTTRSAM